MKKTLAIVLLACFAMNVSAAKKKAPAKDANKPVFTIIKENPITSVKDQNRSGTCWDYSLFVSMAIANLHKVVLLKTCLPR